MKNIKLFFFQANIAYGSTEFYLATLANSLVSKGDYNITVILPDDPGSNHLIQHLDRGITIMKYPTFGKAPMNINFFRKYFSEHNPDILHFNDPGLNGMIAARIAGVKKRIITYHTPTLHVGFNTWGRIAWRSAFDKNLKLITTNEELKHIAIKRLKLPSRNFISIYYGLDPKRFIAKKDEDLKKKLKINNDNFVIGTIGRLEPQKRHDILLKAISKIETNLKKKLKVIIVGDGTLMGKLKKLSKNLNLSNQVIFTGYKRDVEKYLSLMDIFVLSSDFEGACMAIIEAMAMSCAIISTDIPGVRDTLDYGKVGLLVPRQNPQTLAKAISSLLNNKHKIKLLGQASHKRFLEHFTIDKTVDKTDAFYKALMGSR